MSATHLSQRSNWQMGARITGDAGENDFASKIAKHLAAHYVVEHKPKKLPIYSGGRGIVLDTKITNTKTGKSLFIEKKTGNRGGNAHERVYKFLSVPLKRLVHEQYNTTEDPFFMVFSGDTFQKQKYLDEFNLLLEGAQYAVAEPDFRNIENIAKQIMEIV